MIPLVLGLLFCLPVVSQLFSRRHIRTIDSYVKACDKTSTASLFVSVIAITVSVEYIMLQTINVQNNGVFAAFLQVVGHVIAYVVFSYYFFPRLRKFQQCNTLGEIMERMYGKYARFLTAIISVFASLCFIVASLVALGQFEEFFPLKSHFLIISIGVLMMLYTVTSGVLAMQMLYMLHFLLLVVGFGWMTYIVLLRCGSIETILNKARDATENTNTAEVGDLSISSYFQAFASSFFLVMYPTLFLLPPIVQRVLMIKSSAKVQYTFLGFSVFYAAMRFILVIISFGILIMYNGYPTGCRATFCKDFIALLTPEEQNITSFLFPLTLIVIVLGNAYSFLHASVVIISEDIIKRISRGKYMYKEKWTSYIVYGIGGVSTLLALLCQSSNPVTIFSLGLGSLAMLYLPCIVGVLDCCVYPKFSLYSLVPFLVSSFCCFCFTSIGVIYIGNYEVWTAWSFREKNYLLFPFVAAISAMGFFVVHYCRYRKFDFHNTRFQKRYTLIPKQPSWWQLLRHPVKWAQDEVERCSNNAVFVGFVLLFSYFVPNLIGRQASVPLTTHCKSLLFSLQLVGILLAINLMIHRRWPRPLRRSFPLYWIVTLAYCIPFSHILFLLHYPKDHIVLLQFVLGVCLLMHLVSKPTFFLLNAIAGSIAWLVYCMGVDHELRYARFNLSTIWKDLVVLFYTCLMGISFMMRKDDVNTHRIKVSSMVLDAYHRNLNSHFFALSSGYLYQTLKEKVCKKEVNGKDIWTFKTKKVYRNLLEHAEYIDKIISDCIESNSLFGSLIFNNGISSQEITIRDIGHVVREVYVNLPEKDRRRVHLEKKSSNFMVDIVPELLRIIIANLIECAFVNAEAQEVIISWSDGERRVCIQDNGKPMAYSTVPFFCDVKGVSKKYNTIMPFVRIIIEAMQGDVTVATNVRGNLITLTFPPCRQKIVATFPWLKT